MLVFFCFCSALAMPGIISGFQFNMTEYYKMPDKYHNDNYDRCLGSTSDFAAFCGVKTVIKPSPGNEIWQIIEKYSVDIKRNYRHDILYKTICVNSCADKLRTLGIDSDDEKYYVEKFEDNPFFTLNPKIINGTEYYRKTYGKIVNKCINVDLWQKYGLEGHTEINFCSTNRDVLPYDFLDYTFIAVLILIISVVSFGTYYHINFGSEADGNQILKVVAKSFSVKENWERFTSKPSTDMARDLIYVHTFRFLTMCLVVYAHVFIGYNFAPSVNPEFIEEKYQSVASMFTINGMTVVQTFFTISGFLLTLQFIEATSNFKKPFNANYFWYAVFYRYVRLTPVYLFMILFDATWLIRMNNGPGWKRIAESERYFCRNNWWTNLLYINNYVNVPETCIPQSWFLSADFQLFTVAIIILLLIWKYPDFKRVILVMSLLIAYSGQFLSTYVNNFDGVYVIPPEHRKFMNQLPEFRDNYAAGHLSTGNYFIGIVIALMYNQFRKNKQSKFLESILFKASLFGMVVIGLIIYASAYIFYTTEFDKPSIWISFYSVITKNIWGAFGALLMFLFIGKKNSFIAKIFQSTWFVPPGRLVYCIFLCHFSVARWLAGDIRLPIYLSAINLLHGTVTVLVLSTVVAIFLCICLEFPMTSLMKELMTRKDTTKDKCEKETVMVNRDAVDDCNNTV